MAGRYLFGKARPSFLVKTSTSTSSLSNPTYTSIRQRLIFCSIPETLYLVVGTMAPRKKKEKDENESGDSGEFLSSGHSSSQSRPGSVDDIDK
jgi:hypothetical protein